STSTGLAPTCSMTFTEAAKVMGVVITSSPGPMPAVLSAVCSAAVQELRASVAGAWRKAANSVSKRLVLGPVVIQLERSVSTTAAISSSPMSGGEKGRNSVRLASGELAAINRLLRWGTAWEAPCGAGNAGGVRGGEAP